MAKEKNRPEKDPEKDEETRESETGHVEEDSGEGNPGDSLEKEKQQGKEIVNKALNRVKSKLEEQ